MKQEDAQVPAAIRLASQLQTAAYSHGYEDGHPANAASRYSDQAQRLRVALCEEIGRLIAQEAALLDVALMLKRCAWALRRGTAPDLGERALYLLQKHDLLGGPLRDETMDEAGAAGAALYDRWTGKA
jgi:hypothetical protein